MFRTHTQPGWRALAAGIAGALLVTPVTPSAAARSSLLAAPAPDAASDTPRAGDEDIPDEAPEDGQMTPGDKPASTGTGAVQRATLSIEKKGSNEQGFELSDQADIAFDAGNYGEAARLYTKALELISENETNHVTRSVVLANGITAYEQVYATSHELDHLRTAQRVLQEYLRACKTKHGMGCERFPETQEARARLQQVMAAIDTAAPHRLKIPPEIGTAPGGKPYDLTVKLPPAPGWIAPAIVGGLVLAGGGAALIYYAATDDKYGPLYPRELKFRGSGDTGDTSGDTGVDTGADTGVDTDTGAVDTDGNTSPVQAIEFSPETKGKLLIGVGAFLAAAGIGFAVLGSMRLAKHRRLNRERARTLAVTPTFGRSSAGLAVSGRF